MGRIEAGAIYQPSVPWRDRLLRGSEVLEARKYSETINRDPNSQHPFYKAAEELKGREEDAVLFMYRGFKSEHVHVNNQTLESSSVNFEYKVHTGELLISVLEVLDPSISLGYLKDQLGKFNKEWSPKEDDVNYFTQSGEWRVQITYDAEKKTQRMVFHPIHHKVGKDKSRYETLIQEIEDKREEARVVDHINPKHIAQIFASRQDKNNLLEPEIGYVRLRLGKERIIKAILTTGNWTQVSLDRMDAIVTVNPNRTYFVGGTIDGSRTTLDEGYVLTVTEDKAIAVALTNKQIEQDVIDFEEERYLEVLERLEPLFGLYEKPLQINVFTLVEGMVNRYINSSRYSRDSGALKSVNKITARISASIYAELHDRFAKTRPVLAETFESLGRSLREGGVWETVSRSVFTINHETGEIITLTINDDGQPIVCRRYVRV